MEKLRCLKL